MLPLKDARILLSRLQKLSLVETTEVPKSGAKVRINVSVAEYHLWSVDLPRVYNSLLSNIYKTIANTIQRRTAEIDKRVTVLEREAKAAKMSGGGVARQLLQAKDQNDLGSLEESVKKLIVGQERSDMVSFILRDLPGWPQK